MRKVLTDYPLLSMTDQWRALECLCEANPNVRCCLPEPADWREGEKGLFAEAAGNRFVFSAHFVDGDIFYILKLVTGHRAKWHGTSIAMGISTAAALLRPLRDPHRDNLDHLRAGFQAATTPAAIKDSYDGEKFFGDRFFDPDEGDGK